MPSLPNLKNINIKHRDQYFLFSLFAAEYQDLMILAHSAIFRSLLAEKPHYKDFPADFGDYLWKDLVAESDYIDCSRDLKGQSSCLSMDCRDCHSTGFSG